MARITKAVFPGAGMGTRLLPATKASPREMLPIADRRLSQYAVEDGGAAGRTDMNFVTGRGQRAREDPLDKAFELETELEQRAQKQMLKLVQSIIPANVSCTYVRQAQALGLGHAIPCAMPVVGNLPFAVVLADDLLDSSPPALKQMVSVFARRGRSVVAVQNVARQETRRYGIVKIEARSKSPHRISGIVEKPEPAAAPSTLGVVGRYLLTPRIFHHLRHGKPGAGGEIQLTDAIAALLAEEDASAHQFEGIRYACGTK